LLFADALLLLEFELALKFRAHVRGQTLERVPGLR
jgi:hypothetical protein